MCDDDDLFELPYRRLLLYAGAWESGGGIAVEEL